MAKVKPSGQTHYELLYILSNKFTEDEIEPIAEKVNQTITKENGVIAFDENWGKRKLAYQIKGLNHGYYRLVEFDLDGEKLSIIDRYLRMSSDIIRHQIIKKKPKTEEEIKKDKIIEKKIAEKAAKQIAEEKKEKIAKDKSSKKKVDLKELDDKLDKILESNDLL